MRRLGVFTHNLKHILKISASSKPRELQHYYFTQSRRNENRNDLAAYNLLKNKRQTNKLHINQELMASQSQQHTTVDFGDPVANDDSQNNLSFIDSHGVNSSDITSGKLVDWA